MWKFPYADDDIVFFHVGDFDFKSGNINAVFAKGLKSAANSINQWNSGKVNEEYKNKPRGIYGTREIDGIVRFVYPQGEEYAYNDGRDVVRWVMEPLSGFVTVSLFSKLNGSGWKLQPKNFKSHIGTTVTRGQIYAAVRYNNQWRACIIETD